MAPQWLHRKMAIARLHNGFEFLRENCIIMKEAFTHTAHLSIETANREGYQRSSLPLAPQVICEGLVYP